MARKTHVEKLHSHAVMIALADFITENQNAILIPPAYAGAPNNVILDIHNEDDPHANVLYLTVAEDGKGEGIQFIVTVTQ